MCSLKAEVVHTCADGAQVIKINDHKIQLGYGSGGDGYCYSHDSFDCIDNLTDEEKVAIRAAS